MKNTKRTFLQTTAELFVQSCSFIKKAECSTYKLLYKLQLLIRIENINEVTTHQYQDDQGTMYVLYMLSN